MDESGAGTLIPQERMSERQVEQIVAPTMRHGNRKDDQTK